jgi:hypothetical protein
MQFIVTNYSNDSGASNLVWLGFHGLTVEYERGDDWAFKIKDYFINADGNGAAALNAEVPVDAGRSPSVTKFFLDFNDCSVDYSSPSSRASLAVLLNDLLVQYKSTFDGKTENTVPATATITDAKFFVAETAKKVYSSRTRTHPIVTTRSSPFRFVGG